MPEVGMEFWRMLGLLALGTFLLRAIPLLWMLRYLRAGGHDGVRQPPRWLTVLATHLMAAMLGVFLVPATLTVASVVATLTGGLVAGGVWYVKRSLGWPVVAGVGGYALTLLLVPLWS